MPGPSRGATRGSRKGGSGSAHVEAPGHVGRPAGEGVAVGLDAERVEQHRQQGGLVDGHHRVDELEQVVALVEGGPHRVADRRVAVQLVGEPQQRRLEGRPPRRGRSLRDPAHVVGGEPDEAGRRRVVGPQMTVLREPRRAQDQQLAVPGGNRRLAGDVDAERHHRVDQLGHVQQRPEGVADAHLGAQRSTRARCSSVHCDSGRGAMRGSVRRTASVVPGESGRSCAVAGTAAGRAAPARRNTAARAIEEAAGMTASFPGRNERGYYRSFAVTTAAPAGPWTRPVS